MNSAVILVQHHVIKEQVQNHQTLYILNYILTQNHRYPELVRNMKHLWSATSFSLSHVWFSRGHQGHQGYRHRN